MKRQYQSINVKVNNEMQSAMKNLRYPLKYMERKQVSPNNQIINLHSLYDKAV